MKDFINSVFAKPLLWLTEWTGDYALSVLFYLLLARLCFLIFDYTKTTAKLRTSLAKPFVFKIKEKYLGKDSEKFEKATLEVFNVTKTSQFTKAAPILIEYPMMIAMFYVLYHPVSVLFPALRDKIPELSKLANAIRPGVTDEINIMNAVRLHPDAFVEKGFDITAIQGVNTSLFGKVDLFSSAALNDLSIILPIALLAYFAYGLFRMLLPVFQKKQPFKSVALMFGIYAFISLSLVVSAFKLPLIFYLYFIIFLGIGIPVNKIMDTMVAKKKKEWVIHANRECQDILKKYEIEEYVSAIPEKEEG